MIEFPSISLSIDFIYQKFPLLPSVPNLLASKSSLNHFSLLTSQSIIFSLVAQIHQNKRISEQILLDLQIKRSVSCKAGSVVDFQNDGPQVRIKHNIEAEHFKAHIVLDVVWLA